MKKIALIGTYPPPFGGISVYIERLIVFLKKNEIDVECYANNSTADTKGDNVYVIKNKFIWFVENLIFSKEDLFHVNTFSYIYFVIITILKKVKRKKIIINRHGENIYGFVPINSKYWRHRLMIKCFNYGYRNADHIIIVNEKIRHGLNNLGVSDQNISCIPAFIPPTLEIESRNINKSVVRFIRNKKYIISANGHIRFYQREDLYGIDLLITMIERIMDKDVGLIVYLRRSSFMSSCEDKHYNNIKARTKKLSLENRILLHEPSDEEFWPVLARSHIFVRPTNTDGDSVSVREALFFGIKTICSDVTKRPEGVILFKNRDIDDLTEKVANALDEVRNGKINKNEDTDKAFINAHRVLELYNRLLL